MRALLLKTAKVVAVFFGVWLGYVAGFLISFYGGDRDVGSALGSGWGSGLLDCRLRRRYHRPSAI